MTVVRKGHSRVSDPDFIPEFSGFLCSCGAELRDANRLMITDHLEEEFRNL